MTEIRLIDITKHDLHKAALNGILLKKNSKNELTIAIPSPKEELIIKKRE